MFVAIYASLPLAVSNREVSVRQLNELPYGAELIFAVDDDRLVVQSHFSSWRTLGVKKLRMIGSLNIYEHLHIAELIDSGYKIKLRLNGKDRYTLDGIESINLWVSAWARQEDILAIERFRLIKYRSQNAISEETPFEICSYDLEFTQTALERTHLGQDF